MYRCAPADLCASLRAVRLAGDWEGWIKFFLRGVFEVSQAATETARKVLALREEYRRQVKHQGLLDYLFEQPIVSINMVQKRLDCHFPTAGRYIEQFEAMGVLRETTGRARRRRYRFDPYLSLFESPGFTPLSPSAGNSNPTNADDAPS